MYSSQVQFRKQLTSMRLPCLRILSSSRTPIFPGQIQSLRLLWNPIPTPQFPDTPFPIKYLLKRVSISKRNYKSRCCAFLAKLFKIVFQLRGLSLNFLSGIFVEILSHLVNFGWTPVDWRVNFLFDFLEIFYDFLKFC